MPACLNAAAAGWAPPAADVSTAQRPVLTLRQRPVLCCAAPQSVIGFQMVTFNAWAFLSPEGYLVNPCCRSLPG